MLGTCPEVTMYLIYTNATDDVIKKINAALTRHTQYLTMSITQCAEALLSRFPRCREVYDKNVRKIMLIGRLHQ